MYTPAMKYTTLAFLVAFPLLAIAQPAQTPPAPPPIQSPEVLADGSVTFRLRAPSAKEVLLGREGASRQSMQRDNQGVWRLTTSALQPDYYGYSFVMDGVSMLDPNNPLIKPNLQSPQSMVHVPGPSSLPWEIGGVPHGEVHRHLYHSNVTGDDRDYYVYTPAGYDPGGKKLYPVLYLLHGYSDDARGWTDVGFAHVILDNLLAQGKAKPMLVVMPLGYGVMEYVLRRGTGARDPILRKQSFAKYR